MFDTLVVLLPYSGTRCLNLAKTVPNKHLWTIVVGQNCYITAILQLG